mmetsp:Transcript_20013/g.30484  ORF Transcript_20013/g.30484 Transcript_20013/m.30484 type:complete len:272 (-) Transcript_20013:84-899(-)
MRCRNSSIRRRLLIVSAAIAYVAVTTASTQAAATHVALSTTSLSSPHSSHPNNINNHNSDDEYTSMVPTFSCGSHWKSATQCNQLCIDGSDTSCPTGQYCYAGIPCSESNVEESTLRMEAEWMERLIRKRDGNGVKEFVCGVSFEEAESSCGSNGGSMGGGSSVHYCNSGQSSECPSNMQCFASVACGGSSSSDDSSYPSSLLSAASSSPSQQQPIISFSSPTANVTPIILQEEENDDDASSFSYYSFHNIVGTMGSKLWTSLGEFSHSKC